MASFLIIGKGGFGDVLPLLAIAQALMTRGHTVQVAADPHHAQACADIAAPMVPLACFSDSSDGDSLFSQTLQPRCLERDVETLTALAAQADILLGNQLAYAGAIVAERLGKPWVYCPASPLSLPSAFDPPLWPFVHDIQARTRAWGVPDALWTGLARGASRALMWRHMQVRRRLGVRTWAHPRFEALYSPHLNLLPVSSLLVNPQPDWPDGTEVTGFTWFRTRFLGNAEQAEALKAFCLADEPPIVFAPGGHTRAQPEAFVHASIEASRLLNTRAIIVVSPRHHCPGAADDGRVFFSGYQPYADVFEHARAVVHSAGIGTLGWALRAGKPSVLVPGGWDQFDNADRAQRLGVAKVMSPKAYRGPAIANVLREALRDAALHERVAALRERVAAEDGAEVSAHALETWWHEHRAESLSE